MTHPADLDEKQLKSQTEVRFQRRSGPGGQHRNKVETAVILLHCPSQISAEANERRSQKENLDVALFRLRIELAIQIRTSRSATNAPSTLWKSRQSGSRIRVSPEHADFPSILAEALDWLAQLDWDAQKTAEQLGCSVSQFVKLLKLAPKALQQLNQHRQQLGKPPLR
ncbi:MAG: peptide chain release factor-like protein [Planctomycetales bacterium]|nr:peptide chain release factor-like protein [Planctomycetales bacterium]